MIDNHFQTIDVPQATWQRDLQPLTQEFCRLHQLNRHNCETLITRLTHRLAAHITLTLVESPAHLSLFIIHRNTHKIRIQTITTTTTTTTASKPRPHLHTNHRVRIRTTPPFNSAWTVAIPSLSTGRTSFDIQARTSHGTIGTTVLEVQAGWNNNGSIVWLSPTKQTIVFDVLPQSLPLPSSHSAMLDPLPDPLPAETHARPMPLPMPPFPIHISYVTSFSHVPNGQSEILVQTAIGLMAKNPLAHEPQQPQLYNIQFLTTSPVNTSHPLVVRLMQGML